VLVEHALMTTVGYTAQVSRDEWHRLIVESVTHHVPVGWLGGAKFFGSGPACASVKVWRIAVLVRELTDFPVLNIPQASGP
jgi:hypothetical protein